jgi:hypothetical protein
MPNKIILVLGPDDSALSPEERAYIVDVTKRHTPSPVIIGDGRSAIDPDVIKCAVEESYHDEANTTMIVLAHGKITKTGLSININGKLGFTARTLFSDIASASKDKPIDVFLSCCNGSAALSHAALLPKDSALAVLSAPGEVTSSQSILRLFQSIDRGALAGEPVSTRNLFNTYLTYALQQVTHPYLVVSGEGFISPCSALSSFIGQPLSRAQKAIAHHTLDTRIGKERTESAISAMLYSPSLVAIPPENYGPALLLALQLQALAGKVYTARFHTLDAKGDASKAASAGESASSSAAPGPADAHAATATSEKDGGAPSAILEASRPHHRGASTELAHT